VFNLHDDVFLSDTKATMLGGGTTNPFGSTSSVFGNTQQQPTQQTSQNLGTFGNTQPGNNSSAFGTTFGMTIFETCTFFSLTLIL